MPEPTTTESTPSDPEGSGSLDRLVGHIANECPRNAPGWLHATGELIHVVMNGGQLHCVIAKNHRPVCALMPDWQPTQAQFALWVKLKSNSRIDQTERT
jgi:hypothetical protein